MCGLVGYYSTKPEGFDYDDVRLFKRLMSEAMIRGRHATGLAWLQDGKLHAMSSAVPEDQFQYPTLTGSRIAIGHLRYSTSDLQYNQPMYSKDVALVHNGVVTQEPYDRWEELFEVKCEGRNDSEILLRAYEKINHPLTLAETSQAVIMIDHNIMKFWRNEQRPLYFAWTGSATIVASTRDIIERSGHKGRITKCSPCVEYSTYPDGSLLSTTIREPKKDIQP